MAAASFALGAAQAVSGYMGQSAQARAQERQFAANRAAAIAARNENFASLQLRRDQEREATDQELFNLSRNAAEGRGTAVTAAGEAGVTGASVDELLADMYGRQGEAAQAQKSNFKAESTQIDAQMRGEAAAAENRINSVPRGQQPSFLDAALRIGSAGVSAYDLYLRASDPSRSTRRTTTTRL